jgi:hypothetical protein
VLTRPAVERARLAETVGSVVAATPETAGRAVVDLPMRTLCWRCVRS